MWGKRGGVSKRPHDRMRKRGGLQVGSQESALQKPPRSWAEFQGMLSSNGVFQPPLLLRNLLGCYLQVGRLGAPWELRSPKFSQVKGGDACEKSWVRMG